MKCKDCTYYRNKPFKCCTLSECFYEKSVTILNPKKPIKPNYTNSENTIYTNQPEFIILELIDAEINKLKCNIKDLEKIKNDIHYMIKNEVDWNEIYKRIKEDK